MQAGSLLTLSHPPIDEGVVVDVAERPVAQIVAEAGHGHAEQISGGYVQMRLIFSKNFHHFWCEKRYSNLVNYYYNIKTLEEMGETKIPSGRI